MRNELIKLSDGDYFASEGLSNSFLKEFDRCPASAFSEKKTTKAKESGKMFHSYILEPEDFNEKYIITPKVDKRTIEYKELVANNLGKTILSNDDVEKYCVMKKNVDETIFEYETLEDIIKASQKEISCFAELYGMQCRGKFDLLYNQDGRYFIFDLKKTTNALEFSKAVINYKYYRQSAFYKKLLSTLLKIEIENIRFVFIAVEEEKPNGVILYELLSDYDEQGEKENIRSITNYKKWLERNGSKEELYNETFQYLAKPKWMGVA
jgi:exodeoxyribonuclease VIII